MPSNGVLHMLEEKSCVSVQNASSAAAEPSTSSSGASGFVFGQNLSQRAVPTPHKDKEKEPPENVDVGQNAEGETSKAGLCFV